MLTHKYISDLTELQKYSSNLDITEDILRKAESDIDKAIRIFYEGVNRKFFRSEITVKSSDVTLSPTNAVITNLTGEDGYYSRTVLEILSGANQGLIIFIDSSTVSGTTQTLTFAETQDGLSGNEVVKIYQIAKLPRYRDVSLVENKYYKSIPNFIKEAVAFQAEFRLTNQAKLDSTEQITGQSMSKDSVSIEYDTKNTSDISDRISPQAYDILVVNGLTLQTI